MAELAPLMRDQRKVDADHLRLLEIFHFVFAGLALVGIGFLGLHYAFMHALFSNPAMWQNQKGGGPPPGQFLAAFVWVYFVLGALLIVAAIANLASGLFIRRRMCRIFSLIVAGVNCIQIPFGTTLGVFTIVVLLRDSVRELYEV
ncbi:MAG: hypothetical protein ABSA42_06545 [Terracidiphilus sp.]|jgi:hypothetical protein